MYIYACVHALLSGAVSIFFSFYFFIAIFSNAGNTTPWPRPDADQVQAVKIFTDYMNTMPWMQK